ncbi:MAG TPA: hemolysin III family protein, partial [Chloroflexota bacterium]|nr:hemolysin III family protein [Chloroflexota bacterium]
MAQIDTADEAQQQPPRVYAEDFPEAVVDGVEKFLGKPRLRGWIHVYAAVIAFIAGAALVSVSWSLQSTRAGIATLLYTFTIVAMVAVSGTYHRVHWTSATARKWMKRADHSMIFIFIAGSYTPFALLALPSEKGMVLFWIVWGGAIAGALLKMFWPSAPRWFGVPLYILLGWVAVWYIGTILHSAGVAALVLLVVGGALYSIGGIL